MRRTLTTAIAALAALAWPPPSTGAAAAQDETIEEALEQLRRGEFAASDPAVRILRQADGPRAAAELDALADQAAAMVLDSKLPEDVQKHARFALMDAASTDGAGTPYARAFDLLVKVYEGGYRHALSTLMRADSVRGMAYVRGLFERSERPTECGWSYESRRAEPPECEGRYWTFHETPWCQAGGYLFKSEVAEAWARTPGDKPPWYTGYPEPFPPGLPEHVEDWHRRCR